MTISAFEKIGFGHGMRAAYDGNEYRIVGVNFPEWLLALKGDHEPDEDEPFWVRCENAEITFDPRHLKRD